MNKIRLAVSSFWFSFLLFLPDEFSKYRVRYYCRQGCNIHTKTSISPNVRIKGCVEMGSGSSIAQNCTLSGEQAGIFIGRNVMIAPNVVMVAFNHGYENIDEPMVCQENTEGPIVIENDVWIGSNCTIGRNVTIGTGSIITANSFVNKDVPPFSIAGGVPAEVFRNRSKAG